MGFLFCFEGFFSSSKCKGSLSERCPFCSLCDSHVFICVLYQKVNDYREVMCLLLSCSVLVDVIILTSTMLLCFPDESQSSIVMLSGLQRVA